ncbi:hypothetical protein HG535_0F01840 [Zygotorulaspora mrakii]|uniref:Uncharacterized protein n=1 Tax=Zygotorulaspora mrakii TaxID=42260 RepID=A0A7H9B5C8_ZYGMR|nr:uncharacterized protein HG535_0F01840 [Zygotorulaspora mrakii]QLG73673.1 hypothetical protein HG535_0F01840 [Zygotorulaspora mrakii]
MSTIILPGDDIHVFEDRQISLGPGMYCNPATEEIEAVNAGVEVISETKKGQAVYVDYDCKRYVPSVGDLVIGIIVGQYSDNYKVSLSNFSSSVSLSYMAFPNATKKNKPTLKVGDLVYARVRFAEKELESEIECVDSTTGQDGGFGLLDGGMLAEIKLAYARSLMFDEKFPLLPLLAKFVQFEVAIGINGIIWIKCEEVKHTLACYRSILECQKVPTSSYKAIVKENFGKIVNTVEDDNQ